MVLPIEKHFAYVGNMNTFPYKLRSVIGGVDMDVANIKVINLLKYLLSHPLVYRRTLIKIGFKLGEFSWQQLLCSCTRFKISPGVERIRTEIRADDVSLTADQHVLSIFSDASSSWM